MNIHSVIEGYLKDDSEGHTLLSHLLNLTKKLATEKIQSLDDFQKISNFIKLNEFKLKKPMTQKELAELKPQIQQHALLIEKVTKEIQTSEKLKLPGAGLSSVVYESKFLKIAGLGISEQQALCIDNSLKILYDRVKATRLKFWGKILAQGISSLSRSDEVAAGNQKSGQGVNYFTYWVTNSVIEDWQQLPLLTANQVQVARQIKHIFSGDLQMQIKKYPFFQGRQKHLLKAQIIRITHACQIVPKGLYKAKEDNPKEIQFQQGFKIPQVNQAGAVQNWVHHPPYVLNQGRCSFYNSPSVSAEVNAELAGKDPELQRLKSIAEDRPAPGYESNWLSKLCGETLTFNRPKGQQQAPACYGVYLIRNLTWPGAYTVSFTGGWTNIYFGYGLKTMQSSFLPSSPDQILDQPNQIEEYPEPNPKKEPVPPPVAEPAKDAE